jgi:hypothetical protein
MRALLLVAALGGVVGVGFWACNPNSIGRPCVNPLGSDVRGTQISSPALECPSRLCLIQPPPTKSGSGNPDAGARATCTATCNHDSDCSAETKDYCQNGFVCVVASTAGDFCCRQMCVCRDDLQAGVNQDPIDGGTITPAACDPATYRASGTTPTCPNVKL